MGNAVEEKMDGSVLGKWSMIGMACPIVYLDDGELDSLEAMRSASKSKIF